jgi:dipeptidyl aminopeptidase/acylaminoacyl peptidase
MARVKSGTRSKSQYDDHQMPFNETVHRVEDLRTQGVEYEKLIFPDEIHDFLKHEGWLRALSRVGRLSRSALKR